MPVSSYPPDDFSMDDLNADQPSSQASDTAPTDHDAALARIRKKMEFIASEYAAGKLNPAQFNAIYRHYIEKRTIIEKLVERNPETDAWRSVAQHGQTTFLRSHFEARALYYVVFRQGEREPLLSGGKLTHHTAQQVNYVLQKLWKATEVKKGLARKSIGDGQWVVLAIGDFSLSLVVFSLQPSSTQINRMRDLHTDFERANRIAFQRKLPANRMVFPQRALIEQAE